MNASWRFLTNSLPCVVALALTLTVSPGPRSVLAESCALLPQHAGVTFPTERVDGDWACRMQSIIDNYTTASKLGPLRTALTESMYLYLLDHPTVAAALLNRMDFAPYKVETLGSGRYWGDDGEGTMGMVTLVYRDRGSRIYYLEGTHHSRLLPDVSGKAVVFLRMNPVQEPNGPGSMDSTIVSYTKLDNRMLSGLVVLMRPLIGGIVSRKLAKGADAVHRLGLEMRQRPERVLFEATDEPALPADDVVYLRKALGDLKHPSSATGEDPATP